ncbi:hypothetical protein Bca52824_024265 [Brassica carinata]|uniref:Uncharacterized protein n=1 Tax=Brassica carinata TaxID=52824 RepID=A0A8X7VJA6_BRACI|nr:hypothetical protein Bca52824_024265 [Brassica carinata]
MQKVVLERDDNTPPKERSLLHHFSGVAGITPSSILLQEEPPDQSLNRQVVPLDAPIQLLTQFTLREEARNFPTY